MCKYSLSMWKHPYVSVVLLQHIIASYIRFIFSHSVCKGLKVIFVMFFKEVSSAHQACIYLIQSTAKTEHFEIIFLSKFSIRIHFNILFIPVISKLNFSIITTVTWSFRNYSNILTCCSKNTFYYYYIENSWLYFFHVSLINRKFRRTELIWNRNIV